MISTISFVAIGNDQSWSYLVWELLGGENVHLECCLDVEDGLKCVAETSAQVVSLDLSLDSIDVPQMLERIFRDNPSIRAVVLTCRAAGTSATLAIRRGASDYIMKTTYLQDLRWQVWPLLRNTRIQGIGID